MCDMNESVIEPWESCPHCGCTTDVVYTDLCSIGRDMWVRIVVHIIGPDSKMMYENEMVTVDYNVSVPVYYCANCGRDNDARYDKLMERVKE